MGMFAGLRDAKTYENGIFLQPGVYDVEIVKCLSKNTRKSGDAFIAELTVLTSTNAAHPIGSKATWFQGLKDKDVAFGAIKKFCAAVVGIAENDKPAMDNLLTQIEELMEKACVQSAMNPGGENLFATKRVHVQVSMKKTTKGLDFSVHDFSPYKTA